MNAFAPPPGMRAVTHTRMGRMHMLDRPDHRQPAPIAVRVTRFVPDRSAEALTLRGRVERVVEALIDLLDAIDGDTEAERDADDDSLIAKNGDGLLGDADDAEDEMDLGAPEDEGTDHNLTFNVGRIGCPAFDGC
jgi:hypothetical protein